MIVKYASTDESDIVLVEFLPGLKVDLVKAKEMVASRLNLTQNKKHFVIIDISNVKEVSQEAKAFLQRHDSGLKDILGAAFIASNPVSTLIANIFIKGPKDFRAKFFSNKKDAFAWIYEHREQLNGRIRD
jgi:hypothetical protein